MRASPRRACARSSARHSRRADVPGPCLRSGTRQSPERRRDAPRLSSEVGRLRLHGKCLPSVICTLTCESVAPKLIPPLHSQLQTSRVHCVCQRERRLGVLRLEDASTDPLAGDATQRTPSAGAETATRDHARASFGAQQLFPRRDHVPAPFQHHVGVALLQRQEPRLFPKGA